MIHHLNDLEADFRTFYRLTPADVMELSGPHFLRLAYRTTAYQGAMQARAAEAEESRGRRSNGEPGGRVEATPIAIQHDAALADVIDYG